MTVSLYVRVVVKGKRLRALNAAWRLVQSYPQIAARLGFTEIASTANEMAQAGAKFICGPIDRLTRDFGPEKKLRLTFVRFLTAHALDHFQNSLPRRTHSLGRIEGLNQGKRRSKYCAAFFADDDSNISGNATFWADLFGQIRAASQLRRNLRSTNWEVKKTSQGNHAQTANFEY